MNLSVAEPPTALTSHTNASSTETYCCSLADETSAPRATQTVGFTCRRTTACTGAEATVGRESVLGDELRTARADALQRLLCD